MLRNSLKRYKRDFQKFGNSPKSLGWKSINAQKLRFNELLKDLDLNGKTILDFGCGMGNIVTEITARTSNFEYIGVDAVKEFIDIARKTHKLPQVKFLVRDFIKNPLKKKFDIVICSGALNSNITDAIRYRKRAIKILWDHAEVAIAFNMAGAYPQPINKKTDRIYYADSLYIVKYCLDLTSHIVFRANYRKNDFTITMFR